MDLIPGLPEEIGLECLIRLPYHHFSTAASVCRSWKIEVELPEFWRHRKAAGFSRHLVVMAQTRVNPTLKKGLMKGSGTPVYRLTVCDPETGSWSVLPPVPGYANGLPLFCQLAGVGLNLVVMDGLNPGTWEPCNAVFVYNFVSSTWRRGADIPGCPRLFFACASDSDRTVFVAGGHDCEKNALRSAMAYDVATDKWAPLPDMAKERDECKGVFHRGKFHVIGGYCTEMQGRFERSAEVFDVDTWRWVPVEEEFLEHGTCPRTCVEGGDGRVYMCRAGNVVALNKLTGPVTVAELPEEVKSAAWMTAWQGKLMVVGCARFGEPHQSYVLDLKSYRWTKLDADEEFSGHVPSGCCLEI